MGSLITKIAKANANEIQGAIRIYDLLMQVPERERYGLTDEHPAAARRVGQAFDTLSSYLRNQAGPLVSLDTRQMDERELYRWGWKVTQRGVYADASPKDIGGFLHQVAEGFEELATWAIENWEWDDLLNAHDTQPNGERFDRLVWMTNRTYGLTVDDQRGIELRLATDRFVIRPDGIWRYRGSKAPRERCHARCFQNALATYYREHAQAIRRMSPAGTRSDD